MAEPRTPDEWAPPLPPQVRRAARRAERAQARIKAEQDGTPLPPETEGDESAQPENTAPVEQSTTVVEPQEPATGTPEWEQRYRTLQGKYDREVPQLRNQIGQLEHLIATMKNPPPAPPLAPPSAHAAEIPEEDLVAYGPELVEASRRWASAEFSPVISDLRKQIADLKGNQDQASQAQVQDRVKADLDSDPELATVWRRLNEDQGFLQWLQEVDPFSGIQRQIMLNNAYQNGDAVRTGRFFKAYLNEHTDHQRSLPPQTPAPATNGHLAAGSNGVRLEDYAAPGRATRAAAGTPGAPERRIWTNSQIQAFYDDRTKGRFRGREEEADRLERDIFDAVAEGRLVNG